jgi:hypothetical protein
MSTRLKGLDGDVLAACLVLSGGRFHHEDVDSGQGRQLVTLTPTGRIAVFPSRENFLPRPRPRESRQRRQRVRSSAGGSRDPPDPELDRLAETAA